ncbi:MAG: ABC transporter ATP-binding protein [Melioribacteraceae bacterium]|nr:ABC transporter ATP-binding protein [Melioribacteraceae bacterium]MCF8264678.1 ABC transporter ATP-binding protein [Melioribacteraceae bacterium]MCF8413455.1 ABC transporter ATP-binding protein [Melioribacteraceae bacterium]MCF8431594.1 ABC transporter ATP-binding protein [Melioribacteraceae bacterium]
MIEIRGLKKSFGEKKVLRGIDLDIEQGETLAIIGRSGCGKSVLLKHIVGLLFPDDGYVKVEGEKISDKDQQSLYTIRRRFGYLFQSAALFDSMTVEENVSLPLVENDYNFSQSKIDDLVAENLELVGLPGIQKLKPSELSGGMKKRVGLARALITDPDYILYDEPTTGLDPVNSDAIDNLIKHISDKVRSTSIVITHDMFSVENVADKIAMVNEGQIHFTGTPDELKSSNDQIIVDFIKRTGFNG